MQQVISVALLFVGVVSAVNTNREGRDLVVLAAPSVWDVAYDKEFAELLEFQIDFAHQLLPRENVVLLADKHTLPYVDGRTHKIKNKLPVDALLEADIYDVQIRDFAPLGIRELAKFPYSNINIDKMAAHQIDESLSRFIKHTNLRIDRTERTLFLNGADVVDNGVSRAIINEQVVADNLDNLPDWAVLVKLLAVFKQVAFVSKPGVNSSSSLAYSNRRLDELMAFVDDNVLFLAPLEQEERQELETVLRKKFYNDINIVTHPALPASNNMQGKSNCGMYTTLLSTDSTVYVPVFGNDPANWAQGHSTITDKMVVQMLTVSTRKRVVPVNMPHSICSRGLSLRSITWTLRGLQADALVKAAKWSGRRRFLRLLTLRA